MGWFFATEGVRRWWKGGRHTEVAPASEESAGELLVIVGTGWRKESCGVSWFDGVGSGWFCTAGCRAGYSLAMLRVQRLAAS